MSWKLKDVNMLKNDDFLSVECKIRKIKKPVYLYGQYCQKIELYDDDTQKTINGFIIDESYLIYDNICNGDDVRVLGKYMPKPKGELYYNTIEGQALQKYKSPFLITTIISYTNLDRELGKLGFPIDNSKTESTSPSSINSRNSSTYQEWRNSVIKRDKVCQCCGGDKYLEVHHIFNYKNHESLRENVDNGVALCKWCHQKYHSYYGKKANPLSFIEFLNRFGRGDSDES